MTEPPRDADTTIQLLRRAANASLNDPHRTGSLIQLPASGDVLVVGDLHGNLANYEKIVEVADLARHPERHLILHELVHDSHRREPDRCGSFELVERAAALKIEFPERVHLLLGNHELAELIGIPILTEGRMLNAFFALGLQMAYGGRQDEVRRSFKEFVRSWPVAAKTLTGVFISHSSPEMANIDGMDLCFFLRPLHDEEYAKKRRVYNLVWGRDYDQQTADAFAASVGAQVLVVGHQPCPEGYSVPNSRHVILDSMHDRGCYLLLPLDRDLSQQDIVNCIAHINVN